MIAPRMDTRVANLIIKQHDKDRPAAGVAYEDWIATTAAKFKVTEKQVRACIAREAEAYSLSLRQNYATHSQKLAHLMGLTMIETIETVANGLTATKEEVLKESGGASMIGEDGKAVVHKSPDWRARADFAKIAVNIHGMNAPELVHVDVSGKVELTGLSDEELARRVHEATQRISGLLASADGSTAGGVGAGANGAASAKRSVVLDAELHQDGG